MSMWSAFIIRTSKLCLPLASEYSEQLLIDVCLYPARKHHQDIIENRKQFS